MSDAITSASAQSAVAMPDQPATLLDANLAKLKPLLGKLNRVGLGHSIAARRVEGKQTFATISPIDLSHIASVARGTASDIDDAASAASFKAWAHWECDSRRALLDKIADTIEAHTEEIALLESWDTGRPIRFMSKAAARSAENFRFFADRVISARDGLNLPTREHWNVTTRVPIGPVGLITPWNTPFMLSMWKMAAPALAAGCAVVHKPAEWSTLKRLHFKLGGKNPVIIFSDANLERVHSMPSNS
jgi:5-carboxymethyl-2-hydroxymuconic-semialdehyde dehydrogenase